MGTTGERFSEEARVVVLAAGSIESPRLWLNSGLPNPNGWVGRGLTNHFVDVVAALMPFETGFTKGPASGGRADFPGYGSLDLAGVSPAPAAELSAVGLIPQDASRGTSTPSGRVIGRPLEHFLAHIDRLMSVAILTGDDVDQRNGVSLSTGLPPDAHGRVPRIDVVARTRRSIRHRRFLIREATRLLERAGAVETHRLDSPPYLAHIHSTLRMGQRASNSVLDRSGEARWVRRLFVADNSALANALGDPTRRSPPRRSQPGPPSGSFTSISGERHGSFTSIPRRRPTNMSLPRCGSGDSRTAAADHLSRERARVAVAPPRSNATVGTDARRRARRGHYRCLTPIAAFTKFRQNRAEATKEEPERSPLGRHAARSLCHERRRSVRCWR